MSQFTNAQNDLVREIVRGKCDRNRARRELIKLEKAFPEEQFGTYEPKRKEKPWDMSYLRELEELFYHGADSKDFIEYMAEVSEEVYRSNHIRKVLLGALLIVAFIAAIILFIKR